MRIVFSGSIAFHEEMKRLSAELQMAGHQIEIPELEEGLDTMQAGDSRSSQESASVQAMFLRAKQKAMDEHLAKIAAADAVLIVNYPKRGIAGYVGGNTLMEMALAYYLGKKLFVLQSISSELSYQEEILALHPTILEGDLLKIA